ncbi:MAG TPA: TfoX/Sxy family protein [Burkholderiales bacterium]|nr:TfoX/Sxy family protein [Burkholderiales bacterium]
MATDQDFIDYVCGQMRAAGSITSRKMFGEYAIYLDGRIIAFACDNQLFVKPLAGARAFIGTPKEAPPYPGAKMYFLIDEQLDDSQWMSALARVTAAEVPLPKPKIPAAKAAKSKAPAKAARPARRIAKTAAKAVVKATAKPRTKKTATTAANAKKAAAPRKTRK